MVAVDTSTIAAYLGGHTGADVNKLDKGLLSGSLLSPPVVITELLLRPGLRAASINLLTSLPRLPITEGYFERAGELRRAYRAKLH